MLIAPKPRSETRTIGLISLSQVTCLGFPLGRWHGARTDTGLETAGCGDGRDPAGGAFLQPIWSGCNGATRQIPGYARRRRGYIMVLFNMRHASNRWSLSSVVAQRGTRSPTFGSRVGRIMTERSLGARAALPTLWASYRDT